MDGVRQGVILPSSQLEKGLEEGAGEGAGEGARGGGWRRGWRKGLEEGAGEGVSTGPLVHLPLASAPVFVALGSPPPGGALLSQVPHCLTSPGVTLGHL